MNMTTEQADTMIELLKTICVIGESRNDCLRLINMTLNELRQTLEGVRLAVQPVYTTEEAADLLHTSPAKISELRRRGILYAKKSGKGYIISQPDLIGSLNIRTIDWVEEGER